MTMNPKARLTRAGAPLCAVALALTPNMALAGKLSGEKIKDGVTYKVTVCTRPELPKIKGKTKEGYRTTHLAYDAYTAAQQVFADCVEREASEDLQALREIVFAGGQEEIARSQRDIDALKADLDALKAELEHKTE